MAYSRWQVAEGCRKEEAIQWSLEEENGTAHCPGSMMVVVCYQIKSKNTQKSRYLRKEEFRQFVWGGDIWKEQVSHFLECDFFKLTF